jgi:hypothetical protein
MTSAFCSASNLSSYHRPAYHQRPSSKTKTVAAAIIGGVAKRDQAFDMWVGKSGLLTGGESLG